jgi:hypothetical protein
VMMVRFQFRFQFRLLLPKRWRSLQVQVRSNLISFTSASASTSAPVSRIHSTE